MSRGNVTFGEEGVGMLGESGVRGTHKGHPYREGEGEEKTEGCA